MVAGRTEVRARRAHIRPPCIRQLGRRETPSRAARLAARLLAPPLAAPPPNTTTFTNPMDVFEAIRTRRAIKRFDPTTG